ncbi:MAG: mandelate racemase/muconate lactonizing enzyme family protein [Deltaproteobacteria bacterium]|nr:mandelate racemase/muconate lactonizing enzyme family protein [Deltaproteobacteria bacterium]
MKISAIETIPFRIPLKKPSKWARGEQLAAEHLLVKIFTDEGVVGISEALPRPTVYGESIESIKYAIDQWLGPMVIGMDPFELERIWDNFHSIAWNPAAKSSIDIALHDIIGKALGQPCYKLFGCWSNKVSLSWNIGLNSLVEMVKEGLEMVEAYGFKAIKLKTGIDPAKDVEMVKAIRRELGEDILIYIDANQGYDPYTALKAIHKMMEYNIAFVEEPCPVRDIKGRKMVSEKLDIPLMGDESCLTPADVAREIDAGCLRIISIKTARTGFSLSKKIIHLCEEAGIRNLLGLQGETGIGSISSAHLCAAYKNTNFYYPSENSFFLLLTDDILKKPLEIKEGFLELTDAPGLGVEIDEARFKKFRMN